MAIAFRSITTNASGTAANITGTEPANAAAGDILLAFLNIDNATPPTVTGPAGWSNTCAGTLMKASTVSAGNEQQNYVWWIRRGTAAPALTWTFVSSFRELSILAYSGANKNLTDPFSFGANTVRDDAASKIYPNISGTTMDQNEMLLFFGGNWFGGTAGTPPTGFTERLDSSGGASDCEAAEKAQVADGATGTVSGASYTATTNSACTSQLVGLRPEVGREVGQLLMQTVG